MEFYDGVGRVAGLAQRYGVRPALVAALIRTGLRGVDLINALRVRANHRVSDYRGRYLEPDYARMDHYIDSPYVPYVPSSSSNRLDFDSEL